jgi:hypothetical protein
METIDMIRVTFCRSLRLLALVAALGALTACSAYDTHMQSGDMQNAQVQNGDMQNRGAVESSQSCQTNSTAGKPESEACGPHPKRRLPEFPAALFRAIF